MEKDKSTIENFELSQGGPFNRLLLKFNLYHKPKRFILVILCITWLPLLIITAIEGTLYSGTELPFLKDIAMQARILLALPVLILIKPLIDTKVKEVLQYMLSSLMSPEEEENIRNTVIPRAAKLTNSALSELSLLLIVVFSTYSVAQSGAFSGLAEGTRSWMDSAESREISLNFAGKWSLFVSVPLFQFFLLRWLWRYLVWVILLFRLSKANLQLMATHADHCGGLGVIFQAQRNFAFIFVAGSVIISGEFTAELLQYPDHFNSLRSVVVGYIVVCLILLVFPLLFYTKKLVKVKLDGLIHLSHLSASLSNKFEADWVNEKPLDKKISENELDPSMLYDYTGIYDALHLLRPIPTSPRDVISLAVIIFIPFLPILFIHFSVGELIQRIASLLL